MSDQQHHHDHDHDPETQIKEAEELGLSEEFFNHALTPQNVGVISDPDGFAMPKGACGDFIELYINISGDQVSDAKFMPQGCLHTVACGSVLTELVNGKEISEALKVDAEAIEQALGGLPKDHRHCAVLAAATFKAAVRDYYKKKNQPWQRAYGK